MVGSSSKSSISKGNPMPSNLEHLYVELESIDLAVILKAQECELAGLPHLLKKRESQLGKIGRVLGEMTSWGIPTAEQDRVLSLQDCAVFRNKRIVTLLGSLYTLAKEEFLKLSASRAKASPYGRVRTLHGRFSA